MKKVFVLGAKNLFHNRSRTIVTIGAIALGTGAIVFLVSFSYGLQDIVTKRLVQPNSLRLTDVQSDSTSLSLNPKTINEIKSISGVKDIAVAVSLAGSVEYKKSKMDVVVVGVSNKFLEYSHQTPLEGEFFSKKAEEKYVADCWRERGLKRGLKSAKTGGEVEAVRNNVVAHFSARQQRRINSAKTGEAVETSGVADFSRRNNAVAGLNLNNDNAVADFSLRQNRGMNSATTSEVADCPSELEQLAKLIQQSKEEEVLGIATEAAKIKIGDPVNNKKIRFRIDSDQYIPLRNRPIITAKIIGYTTGDIIKSYSGIEVWGGSYQSVSTKGKAYQDSTGNWYGLWIKAKVPLYKKSELLPDVFEPVTDENGAQQKSEGYLTEEGVKILTSEEILLEKQFNKLSEKFNILGASTPSAEATSSSLLVTGEAATEAAELKKIVVSQQKEKKKEELGEIAVVEVKKKGGKEAIVSTGFLNALKLKPKDVIGKQLQLTYIISGGMIPKTAGRILSKPVKYKIIGIIDNKKKLMVFVPLADVESIGVKKYTMAKVLAADEQSLPQVREKIESLGFVTRSIVDTLAQVDKLFKVMRFLLGAFGAIALIVAIFGMFNTLTVSLLERTREIAVMKTLGTKDSDVVRLFIAESMIIGFLGGLVGIFLGVSVGKAINLAFVVFRHVKGVNLFVSPLRFLIVVLFLSIAVGILTGIYPSYRAKKINPLDAIRYE